VIINYIIGASSIGTSINSQFIAHFASATGKRANHDFDSEESDPEVYIEMRLEPCTILVKLDFLLILHGINHFQCPLIFLVGLLDGKA
jgi:hypothetical protein